MNKVESALQRTTDTKDLIIGAGVVSRTAEMFAKLFPGKTAIIVADLNTWEVAGKAVFASLEEAGIPQEKPFIFTDEELYAEWQHVEKLQAHLRISISAFSNSSMRSRIAAAASAPSSLKAFLTLRLMASILSAKSFTLISFFFIMMNFFR